MKKVSLISLIFSGLIIISCVSKKKFVALQQNHEETQSLLSKSEFERNELENKFARIEKRVASYNRKIMSLSDTNENLEKENNAKLEVVNNSILMSNDNREQLNQTLAKIDPSKLANAKTLKDSINLALDHNLQSSFNTVDNELSGSDDIDVTMNGTVVMITVSDKLLFNSGSYRVNTKAYSLLSKLSNVIKSEPSMEVMVEGHTDSRTIQTVDIKDNWDLSVKRATSIVRLLQKKYDVNPQQLIASGRSSFIPVADNSTKENRAKNRRTRIVILPNIDKFFSLMASK